MKYVNIVEILNTIIDLNMKTINNNTQEAYNEAIKYTLKNLIK